MELSDAYIRPLVDVNRTGHWVFNEAHNEVELNQTSGEGWVRKIMEGAGITRNSYQSTPVERPERDSITHKLLPE